MHTLRTYFYTPAHCLIHDGEHPYDESAALAGLVKNIYEDLTKQVKDIGRLTAVTVPSEERRAQLLLESLINAKRSFMNQEEKRKRGMSS